VSGRGGKYRFPLLDQRKEKTPSRSRVPFGLKKRGEKSSLLTHGHARGKALEEPQKGKERKQRTGNYNGRKEASRRLSKSRLTEGEKRAQIDRERFYL